MLLVVWNIYNYYYINICILDECNIIFLFEQLIICDNYIDINTIIVLFDADLNYNL